VLPSSYPLVSPLKEARSLLLRRSESYLREEGRATQKKFFAGFFKTGVPLNSDGGGGGRKTLYL